ncbi:deferrochelatase/peroxidase EfeB [Sporosarcina sp. P21c]|uniref:iron uptake transporter deferrochelatase/peroxidase subunit n=1 Tax=unclassified Sporosarcina TaxID=2647733 RepID=UPI000C16796E|nr:MULTISPECIES: iron uptake transporter deferrochelatase/peroxidase subunit [unclassified Sporosarcina]PIC66027.1 deferrochelatase/peroxidase EfeB [Sporosarcina sp. P16a]PIC89178.1 deferrochelatase/peroxidase EfeB [Sporosarcina sp. P21c]PIC92247.1 deferrochelatase/peroxidase EfeB [Sporosarcina sp. P25]
MTDQTEEKFYEKKISRRQMLKYTGAGAAGVAIGASGLGSVLKVFGMVEEEDNPLSKNKINFYGKHQSGIATECQSYVYFASLNVLVHSQQELMDLFKTWTPIAVRMMNGEQIDGQTSNMLIPAKDTGEAVGLDASNLTLTFGVGPSLFEKESIGLASKKPSELKDLPHFPKDQLDPTYTGGDICIQACADDPQVAFHAVRNLVRIASGKVSLKWTQAGFNSYPMKGKKKETPRNLFAFKDGSVNPNGSKEAEMNEVAWIDAGQSKSWMTNGTYMAVRRVQMHLETWDRTALREQEATFGRHRDTGAPIGKEKETDEVDLDEKDANGEYVISQTSHVRLAKKSKKKILRRSFSYSSGVMDSTGTFDAGLLFISFQKDPEQFIAIQNSFGREDKLNEYITHRGSALFACFPGIQKGGFIGDSLFSII